MPKMRLEFSVPSWGITLLSPAEMVTPKQDGVIVQKLIGLCILEEREIGAEKKHKL